MPGPNTPIIICLNIPKKVVWCLPITVSAVSRKACRISSFSWKDVALDSPRSRTLAISDLRYGTPLLFFLNDIKHFIWNWSVASFNYCSCSRDSSSMVTSITSTISGILISAIEVPLGMPKSVLTQNPHSAPSRQQVEQASFTHE
jgi:hypothetical protein